jgi:prolyl-tRNA synthetase
MSSTDTLPSREHDFPAWYADVVRRAELAEHSSVRGAMVIKPYGYTIWERIQRALDDRIKATGHENMYFPLFIPAELLERERTLVEGFAPEVAVVTHAGGKELASPLIVRPTSEAQVWSTYGKWIRSYRDLPLLYNQWANVVRWELRPRLFLRTTEFLWQEGHTAHETEREALAETLTILHDVYADAAESVLGLAPLRGRKSAAERFPGAVETFALEAMMGDGKALQAATSHYLGQNFARTYDVRFTDREGVEQLPYASSWGASTRLVGGVIMAHGDDRGLRLPPELAPYQVVVVPIAADGDSAVAEAAGRLAAQLRATGVRVKIDDRDGVRPGAKFHEWELRGAPLRAELGARDLVAGVVTLARRDTLEKQQVPLDGAAGVVPALLEEIQEALHAEALDLRERRTIRPESYDHMREFLAAAGGFAVAPWCGSPECERRVKDETSATIRCLPLEPADPGAPCIVCGAPGTEEATWAQAY